MRLENFLPLSFNTAPQLFRYACKPTDSRWVIYYLTRFSYSTPHTVSCFKLRLYIYMLKKTKKKQGCHLPMAQTAFHVTITFYFNMWWIPAQTFFCRAMTESFVRDHGLQYFSASGRTYWSLFPKHEYFTQCSIFVAVFLHRWSWETY